MVHSIFTLNHHQPHPIQDWQQTGIWHPSPCQSESLQALPQILDINETNLSTFVPRRFPVVTDSTPVCPCIPFTMVVAIEGAE